MKLNFISLITFLITLAVSAQKGVRVGYIDMDYILESVPEYAEANTQLEKKVDEWRKYYSCFERISHLQ